jgi:Xaa-Pro dipeptidase
MRTPPNPLAFPTRRDFLRLATAASALSLPSHTSLMPAENSDDALPPALRALKPLDARLQPIRPEEFRARLLHAQELMSSCNPNYEALLIGPGTSLYYFTGIHWGLSERLLGLLLPRSGSPVIIVPAFEEGRLRERMRFPVETRAWQEDQSPTKLAAAALGDRGTRTGRVGIEESLPYTFFDHLREAAPGFSLVSADPITVACRAHKSNHELDLMRLACAATCEVFRAVFNSLQQGMSQEKISGLIDAGFSRMNLRGEALVLLGASAALPHGSLRPQTLKDGDVVLIDGGCAVDGYQSDVTRTGVLGTPSDKIRHAFEIVRKAQDAALDAARAGKLSGTVDDAARTVITGAGFGPDYKFFTHRLGHGIGLDGHEHPYLVRGSKTVLESGMTFSYEPGIFVPGEFGMRCEDLMVVTAGGPAQLLTPGFAGSLEKPLG